MALPLIEKCDNFRSENLEVTQAYDKIKLSCSEEDALIIQMAIISFARCFHRVRLFQAMGRFAQANFTVSEMYKLDESFKFDINIMLELKEYVVPVKIKRASLVENKTEEVELDADDVLALFHEDLVEEHFILFKFIFNKYFELGLQCFETEEFRANYNNMEGKRKECSEKLDKINRCLDLLDQSERYCINTYIYIIVTNYKFCLIDELDYLMRVEKFKIVENALNECRSSIGKAKKHPEDLFLLNSIRDFINLCPYKTVIWKTLYERCAHGIIEDQWSENHYGEFLPELEEILKQAFANSLVEYHVRENIMKREYALGRFENLIDRFIKSA